MFYDTGKMNIRVYSQQLTVVETVLSPFGSFYINDLLLSFIDLEIILSHSLNKFLKYSYHHIHEHKRI